MVLARLGVGGPAVDLKPDVARAGERDQVDVGMIDQRLADVLAEARQKLKDAGR